MGMPRRNSTKGAWTETAEWVWDLVLHEKLRAKQSFYSRIAEVGYTRQGTSLAIEGTGEPECVVTGGKGTMKKVSYKGKTYYVCCTGCCQAFDDDPVGVIAQYKNN